MARARKALEDYFNRRWYGEDRTGALSQGLAKFYARLIGEPGRPPSGPLECAVIVVGNITVGGGGKTPVVAALAERLRAEGFRPAIVSRGYGGQVRGPARVARDADPGQYGDEPVLLARRTECPVWIGRDRAAAVSEAVAGGADVVVCDDGLQNRRLRRSFEICVIDGARGFGNGRLLPAGPLRQPVGRLDLVDMVLLKHPARGRTLAGLPGIGFDIRPGTLRSLDGRRSIEPAALARSSVDAVCGIANPDAFFATLNTLGLSFRAHALEDHHAYTRRDLERFEGPLVVTEKDAVKIEPLEPDCEVWVLPIEAHLPEEAFGPILSHVREFSGS